MKPPKQNANLNIEIEVNGQKYKLGKLFKITVGYCPSQKRSTFNFKCYRTGKSFTDIDKLSEHISEVLIKTGKIQLL